METVYGDNLGNNSAGKYRRLELEPFGRKMIRSGDLSPVDLVLARASLPEDQLCRWLVEHWCLDDAGAASYLSEQLGIDMLRLLWRAATETRRSPIGGFWPRGPLRGHFRDALGREAVEALHDRYGDDPAAMVRFICGVVGTEHMTPVGEMLERVSIHHGFSPKVCHWAAGMVDRVLGVPVAFDNDWLLGLKAPCKCADMVWSRYYGKSHPSRPGQRKRRLIVAAGLAEKLSDLSAPPLGDRPVGVLEVATILTKWRLHWRRKYPLFHETREVADSLDEWSAVTETAARLRLALPRHK